VKLPAVEELIEAARRTAARFPVVLLSAATATTAALIVAQSPGDRHRIAEAVLLGATLGLPLLFALQLIQERHRLGRVSAILLNLAGMAILSAFAAVWHTWPTEMQVGRYFQLSIAFHLAVAFLPYAGVPEEKGFWQYNRALFLRFLQSGLYSFVLCAGLSIALLAVDKLLGISVPSVAYRRLGIVIAFLFNTWVFLGGVPSDLPALDDSTDYPAGLRIFTRYVLVSLVTVYLVILTIYLGKVIVTRQWPSGWIGYLVTSVAITGILSWLLVRPLEERVEQAWIQVYSRGFFIAIMPSIVMVWLAIWKRVDQYGITERRYFMIVLSAWLAGISLYYAVRRARSIRAIPASLGLVALVTYAGPWGAYHVSQANQTARLEQLLARNDMLAGGKVQRAPRPLSDDDRRRMSSALEYLQRAHGDEALAKVFGDSMIPPGRTPSGETHVSVAQIMVSLGVPYLPPRGVEAPTQRGYFSYYIGAARTAKPIGGYTHAVTVPIDRGVFLRLPRDSGALELVREGAVVLRLPLDQVREGVEAYRQVNGMTALPDSLMRIERRDGDMALLVYLSSLIGREDRGHLQITSVNGEAFVRLPVSASMR